MRERVIVNIETGKEERVPYTPEEEIQAEKDEAKAARKMEIETRRETLLEKAKTGTLTLQEIQELLVGG